MSVFFSVVVTVGVTAVSVVFIIIIIIAMIVAAEINVMKSWSHVHKW